MIGGKGDAESLEGFQVFFGLPRIFALESKVNAAVLFAVALFEGGFFGVLDTVLDCWDIFKTIFRKKK